MTEIAKLRALWEALPAHKWEVRADRQHPTVVCSIVAPAGDAEIGTWMIAERVRWPEIYGPYIAAAHHQMGRLLAIAEAAQRFFVAYDVPEPLDSGDAHLVVRRLDELRHMLEGATPEPKAIYEGTGDDL